MTVTSYEDVLPWASQTNNGAIRSMVHMTTSLTVFLSEHSHGVSSFHIQPSFGHIFSTVGALAWESRGTGLASLQTGAVKVVIRELK